MVDSVHLICASSSTPILTSYLCWFHQTRKQFASLFQDPPVVSLQMSSVILDQLFTETPPLIKARQHHCSSGTSVFFSWSFKVASLTHYLLSQSFTLDGRPDFGLWVVPSTFHSLMTVVTVLQGIVTA